MAARRSAAVLVVVLFVLASLGASARAQFGSLLKKTLPKPPGSTAPAAPLYCQDITPELVEQLLKGLKGQIRIFADDGLRDWYSGKREFLRRQVLVDGAFE